MAESPPAINFADHVREDLMSDILSDIGTEDEVLHEVKLYLATKQDHAKRSRELEAKQKSEEEDLRLKHDAELAEMQAQQNQFNEKSFDRLHLLQVKAERAMAEYVKVQSQNQEVCKIIESVRKLAPTEIGGTRNYFDGYKPDSFNPALASKDDTEQSTTELTLEFLRSKSDALQQRRLLLHAKLSQYLTLLTGCTDIVKDTSAENLQRLPIFKKLTSALLAQPKDTQDDTKVSSDKDDSIQNDKDAITKSSLYDHGTLRPRNPYDIYLPQYFESAKPFNEQKSSFCGLPRDGMQTF